VNKRIVLTIFLPVGIFFFLFGLFIKNHILSGILIWLGIILQGLSAAIAVPMLAQKETSADRNKIDWQDERNKVIREKASWYTGMIIITAMGVSALALALTNHVVGACVIAGLLLLYSMCVIIFSAYFSKKL
jgi:uncharacterized membrane protein YiaA